MSAGSRDPDTVEAIVVGGVDYGEADRVVHLLTESGRLAAFAHGARKSRKRFAGALDPFVTVQATLATRKTGLPTLSRAVVARPRLGIRSDLERIALASYVAELAEAVAPEGDPAPELYGLVAEVLDAIASEPASRAARRAFEIRLMDASGYQPNLAGCTTCGRDEDPVVYVDFHRGGLFCADHRQDARVMGPKTRQWVTAVLVAESFTPLGGVSLEWAATAAQKVGPAVDAFFAILVTRALRSIDLLADLSL